MTSTYAFWHVWFNVLTSEELHSPGPSYPNPSLQTQSSKVVKGTLQWLYCVPAKL